MVQVSVQMFPTQVALVRDFNNLARRVNSTKQPLERIRDQILIPDVRENFDSESASDEDNGPSRDWEPLSDAAANSSWRAGGPILRPTYQGNFAQKRQQLSGTNIRLKTSAVAKARWTIEKGITDGSITMNLPPQKHAEVHQFGGGKVPARPYMWPREKFADRSEAIFEQWVGEQIVRWGSRATVV